jgi:hypothetical protein
MTYKVELLKPWTDDRGEIEVEHGTGDVVEVGKSIAHMLVRSNAGIWSDKDVGPAPKPKKKARRK